MISHLAATESTPSIVSFEVGNLPSDTDVVQIKRQLSSAGLHVTGVDIKEQMLSQKRPGSARIEVRTHGTDDEAKVKSTLNSYGLSCHKKGENHKVVRAFDGCFLKNRKWTDAMLEGRDKVLKVIPT